MYVRVKTFEANTLGDHAMPYRCVHCGYETTARTYAFATGGGISPYGLDDKGAAARAARGAQRKAEAQARLSIRIAPCPRCHRHDGAAVAQVRRTTLLWCLVVMLGVVLLLKLGGQAWGASVVFGLMVGAVPAGLYWKHRTAQLTSKAVRFDPPAESAVEPPASAS